MATDMDIDMDIDFDIDVGDFSATQPEPILSPLPEQSNTSSIAQPNTSLDPEASVLAPTKVHLRGLDNLKSHDIKAFAKEYFPIASFERIEWIDDTSANLLYADEQVAREALNSFCVEDITTIAQLPAFQMLSAKPFPEHPETRLEVRLAVVGDRKQAGARDRSRFYLFNPEYDPAERRKRDGPGGERGGGRRYRERDDGGYRNQVYDSREQKRREEAEQFDASLYDDDKDTLAARAAKRGSSASSGEGRYGRNRLGEPKELFPSRAGGGGRRERSASPQRNGDNSGTMRSDAIIETRRLRNERASAGNRNKADAIREVLRNAGAAPKKELFPQKHNERTFDIADQTTTSFANIGLDGADDSEVASPRDLISRISRPSSTVQSGFSIRGRATPDPQGISIKGKANAKEAVRELFPMMSGNAGKELFGKKLDGRGGQRKRAEDLFR